MGFGHGRVRNRRLCVAHSCLLVGSELEILVCRDPDQCVRMDMRCEEMREVGFIQNSAQFGFCGPGRIALAAVFSHRLM